MRVKQWLVLVYRVPSEPASKRVGIWRDLKRMGALYLQQCVCILPDLGKNRAELERVMAKVPSVGGETVRFVVPRLDPGDEARIIQAFREQRTSEYAEIIEECETKFQKEIEFEHFRQNYTFEEVEEIEQDLEKIRRWYDRVKERDWFNADRSDEVGRWIDRCQELLNGFVEEVYKRQNGDSPPHTSALELDEVARRLPDAPPPMRLPLGRRKRSPAAEISQRLDPAQVTGRYRKQNSPLRAPWPTNAPECGCPGVSRARPDRSRWGRLPGTRRGRRFHRR